MQYDAALDTSATKTAICVLARSDGSIVFEATVPTDPAAIVDALNPYRARLHLLGHEAGALSPWLHRSCKRGLCRWCYSRRDMLPPP